MSSRRSRLCQRSPRSSRRPWRTSRCRRRCWNIGSCLEAAAAVASSRRQQESQRGAEGAGPAAWRSSRSRSARSGRNGVLHDRRAGLLTPLCPWRWRAGGQHCQHAQGSGSVPGLPRHFAFCGPKTKLPLLDLYYRVAITTRHAGGSDRGSPKALRRRAWRRTADVMRAAGGRRVEPMRS